MDEWLARLKTRLGIDDFDEDALLTEYLYSARETFLARRWPTSQYPVDAHGEPIIAPRWTDWILRAAVEMYNKRGAEGQTIHTENGINRHYESGTLSQSLLCEVAPVVGLAR